MKEKQNCLKGEKVWIEVPAEGNQNKVHPAEVISVIKNSAIFKDKTHVLVRYLDKEGLGTYECIPSEWILEIQGEQ